MRRHVLAAALALAASLAFCGAAVALQTNGVAASEYATGFAATPTGLGPIGLATDHNNRLFVVDAADGYLYRFNGPGAATPATRVGSAPVSSHPSGLAFDGDGRLYLARVDDDEVVELNPSTGAVVRKVADIGCPTAIAADPVSGDLFVSRGCSSNVYRIANTASNSPQPEVFAVGLPNEDGLTVAPDGT